MSEAPDTPGLDALEGVGAGSVDRSPGVRVRRTDLLDAEVRVQDPETGPRAHRALLDAGLDRALLEALAELPGEEIGDYRAVLDELGADALDGLLATMLAKAAGALDVAAEHDLEVGPDGFDDDLDLDELGVPGRPDDPIETALETLRALGTGMTPQGHPTSRDDLERATPALLAAATSTTRIAIEITGAWFDRSREHREDVLELVLELAKGADVVLRPSTIAARRLHEQHRDLLPAHVTERVNPRRTAPAHARASQLPERERERLADAREALDPDGTPAAALRALSDAQSDSLTYRGLRRELRIEGSHPRVVAQRLEELGLVERLTGSDGHTIVSLLPLGTTLLEEWRSTVGAQSVLQSDTETDADLDSSRRSSPGRYDPPKSPLPCRVGPPEDGGPPQHPPADPAAEASSAASGDRTDAYAHGAVSLGWMDRARHAAVAGSARSGEVSICNAELEPMLEKAGDGREPAWSFDEREDVLAVGAEFHNPMQYWVGVARALAAPRTWKRVLDVERVGPELEALETDDVRILRRARCLGWLPDEAADSHRELVDEFREAYEELLELTARLRAEDYDDRDEFRGQIQRYALGLAGTMSHLLDLAGVEVVREVRIPEFSDKFSKGGHTSRRRDLCKTIAIGAAIQSRYGHHVAYRQLLEDRPDKIEQALDPEVDAADPLAELHGSIVISGHGVEGLEDELRRALERPKEYRSDAPEIAVRIPVRLADGPATTKRVAEVVARSRELELTRESIVALHGFARSPYAVAEAMTALGSESVPREIHLDELRLALGSLEDDRLLPDATPAARSGLAALLRAEEPISQAELARRAGISAQSWRNHRDALEVAGLVDETPDGWRCTLPFRSERYEEEEIEAAEPWILDAGTEQLAGGADGRRTVDVLEELAHRLGGYGIDVVDEALVPPYDEGPSLSEALLAMDAGILQRFVEAHPGPVDGDAPAALLGPELEQVPITDAI